MKHSTVANAFKGMVGAVAAAVLLTFANTGHAQTNLYSSLTLPAAAQTGAVQFMQIVDPANGAGTYSLSSFELGLNFNTGTEDQGVEILFFTGVNTSPTATDALATATEVGGVNGTLAAPGAAGNYTYTFTLNTPQSLATPDGAFGVVFELTDTSFANLADDINGRFSAVAPTIGTAPGYVWNDANLDGTFAGSEQTKFGQTGAYVRFSMGGTFTGAPAPEPGTWVMMVGGFGFLMLVARRRLV